MREKGIRSYMQVEIGKIYEGTVKNIFIQLSIEGDFHIPTGGKCLPELFGIVGNGHIDKLFLAAAGTQ